jgi:hypothetical protein
MRTLYIHVGPPKTGTSAIQQALLNDQRSARPVVLYPQIGLSRGGSHNDLVGNLLGDDGHPSLVRVERNALLADLERTLSLSRANVVISSEALAGRQDIGQLVDTLTGLLGGDVAVEGIVVCREHFSLASSLYNQRVKDGWTCERRRPDEFLDRGEGVFRYQTIIRRLQANGLKVTALNYHPGSSLVHRFLLHLGFPEERLPPAEMRNVSLSPKALIATLAANNVAANSAGRERYFAAIRRMQRIFAPSKFIFSAQAALEASRAFQADRKFLEAEMGVVLPGADLSATDGGLYLDERELEEIREVMRPLGEEGHAVADYAAGFRRAESQNAPVMHADANPKISERPGVTPTEEGGEKRSAAGTASDKMARELKREFAARKLPEHLALAEEWFSRQKGDDARLLAATLIPAWKRLRLALKRHGLLV